jgi:hypothetical protein
MSQTAPLPTIDEIVANVQAAQAKPAETAPAAEPASVAAVAPAETVPTESAAEPVATETPAPAAAAPAPSKEEELASRRFAALSRKERELRQKEQEAQARVTAAEARAKELEEREKRFQDLKKSPLKVLKDLGISYADLTQDAIGAYKEPEVDPTEKRFQDLQSKIDEAARVKEELAQYKAANEQREVEAALRDVMDTIKETASDEKYEYIQTLGDEAYSLVKDVMAEYYQQHQKLLDYSEACDIVEKYYEEGVVAKLTSTKKVKSRFTASAPAKVEAPKATPTPKEVSGRPTTLTNAAASAASKAKPDIDKMSKQEALSLLANQLRFID